MIRYYIFAANAEHADYYARQSGLGGINRRNVTYVSGPEILYGVQKTPDVKFLFYNTWREHQKWREIRQQVQIIEATS